MTDFKGRTKRHAVRIMRSFAALPKSTEAQALVKQPRRGGTSVGAHEREASRSRSTAEFFSESEDGVQEPAESACWLESPVETEIMPAERLSASMKEADELTAILITWSKNPMAMGSSK